MKGSTRNATGILILAAILGGIPFYALTSLYHKNRMAMRVENETLPIYDKINAQLRLYQDTIRSVESLRIIRQAPRTADETNSIQLALDTLRTFIQAASLFVLNDRGVMVEGSGKVTIGANFQFRTYFQKAMEGLTYVHPALGVHHKTLRLFFSAPVSPGPDGRPSGVVAFSVEMPTFEALLQSDFKQNIYGIITGNGVVFASNSKNLLYTSVLKISQEELRIMDETKQYSGKTIKPAGFLINRPTVSLCGENYIVHRKKFSVSNIELFSLIRINRAKNAAFFLGAFMFYALVCFLAIKLFIANIRKSIAEKETFQRNIELEASNLRLQQEIGQRLAAETALAETNRQLKTLSTTDPLTGLANRRHFNEVLANEYARHACSGSHMSLIMLDIDCFKAYNDRYGHVKGDECLQRIGAVLSAQMLRPADVAARYGGEEFVCLLPETSDTDARQIAESLRRAIRDLGIEHEGSSVASVVTASLGVVTVGCVCGGRPETVVAEADAMLYRAKSEGRDRVLWSRGSESP